MSKSNLFLICASLSATILVPNCRPDDGPNGFSQGGAGGVVTSQGGSTPTGGSTSTTPTGGITGTGGVTSTAGIASTGGKTSTGGATSPGGSVSTGGTNPTGGVTSTAGVPSTGGTTSTAGSKTGGVTSTGGTTPTGGVTSGAGGSAGTTSTGGTTALPPDKNGIPVAKPGDSTSTSKAYLNLGDMRLLCNKWGSDATGCGSSTQLTVAVNSDKTFGYSFNRGTCDAKHGHPDYPEIEFGVAPFGKGSSDLTSPDFSSTTLLPVQLKDLKSASVNFDSFNSTYQKAGYYDTNFEFWISRQNPIDNSNPQPYAEIIIFLDWDNVRESSTGWPCENLGNTGNYKLCHQSDSWGSGSKWRFFNFELNGQQKNVTGKHDVKALLDFVKGKYSGFSDDMWLTRIEVGTEVDDNTQGSAKINNLTFEINGTSKSVQLAQ